MALTDAQMTDARRYLGYPLSGTTQPVTADQDTAYMAFGMVTMSLYARLTTLSATEETVVVSYLATLADLEAAIPAAGANLDTAQAAVWTRNKSEVADRIGLFNEWRRQLAAFLGCPPGPALQGGGAVGRLSRG